MVKHIIWILKSKKEMLCNVKTPVSFLNPILEIALKWNKD
jgi:hypothetical protein